MKTKLFASTLCVAAFTTLGGFNASAQTATWTGAIDADWNTAGNWDALDVPGVGTNAYIYSGTIGYNTQMTAPSFASLYLSGATLTVNTNAFTIDGIGLGTPPVDVEANGVLTIGAYGAITGTNGGALTIGGGSLMSVAGTALFSPASGAALNLSGTLSVESGGSLTINGGSAIALSSPARITNNGTILINNMGSITLNDGSSALYVEPGSTFTMSGTTSSESLIVGSSTSSSANAIMTVEGGTVTLDKPLTVRSASRVTVTSGTLNCPGGSRVNNTGNDGPGRFQIDNGNVNLGNFFIYRTSSAGGLIVNNGVVNATAMQIGTGNSTAYATINGGIVTNTGVFTICDNNVVNSTSSTDRRQRLLIRGGTVVSTGSGGIIVGNQSQLAANTSGRIGGILDINSGSLTAEGITLLKDNTIINNWGIFNLSGSGAVYLGSLGLTGNTGPSSSGYVISFSGGTLGAKADYAINANTPITGTMTFKAADAAGTAHNITHNGTVTSSGALTKTGNGILTLNGANSYSGATTISAGTLALGASATLSATPQINVAAGATFDASAPGGFTLTSGKLLAGSGSVAGAFRAASGSTITVGDTVGTLTFSTGLAISNSVIVNFEISPVTNDLIEISGNLDVSSGTNTVSVNAVGGNLAAGTYTLFHYGSFTGSTNNFVLVGAPGYLTNNIAAQAIQLVTTGLRGPANVTWVGNASVNNWDVLNHTNWLNGAALDSFVQGDTVLFNATGSANPSVNITDPVNPASIMVDAATDYAFSGAGAIGGSGGLTKTNTGTLTVMTINSYSGPTIIGQGTLEVLQLANGGANSSIGSANNSTNNLVFFGGTLKYSGANASTDRGATLNDAGGIINVTNSNTVLTGNGTIAGLGALTKSGPGTLVLAAANSYAGGTVVSNGVLQINAATSAGSATVTNVAGTFRVNGALVVDNAMEFDGNTALEFNGVGSGNVALRGAWSGGGTVNVNFLTQNSSQTFSIGGEGAGGGTMSGFSGTVNFGTNSGFVRLNNNSTYNYGSPAATFNLGTGSLTFLQRNGGTGTTFLGALMGGPNTRLSGARNDVHGLITYEIGGNNLSTVFAGTITNGTGTSADTTAITKVGTGMLTLTGTNYHTSATTVNDGELRVDGAILNSQVTVNSGTLSGSGRLGQSVSVSGTLSPGDSAIGALTVNGNLSLNGSTFMEVNKTTGTNDLVTGINNLYYSGSLVVSNLSGTLTNGTVFKLFSAQTYNGDFYSGITLPDLAPGLSWQTNLLVDGTIRIPPLTNSPALVSVVSGSSLTLSWPGTHTGWTLEVQTNDLSIGLTGVWTPVPGSDLVNTYNATINPDNQTVFYRLVYTP